VLVTDDTGVEHTGLGVERVDSGVDTQLGDTTGQDSGGVQVSEGGGRGRVSQIVSGHVDGLDGGDRTLLGGSDTLLHDTHVNSQGGLVTDSRGDTTQKGRHLGTGLGETENVVNEEQHILTLLVTEVLGDGETSQGNTGTGTWGLVHLTEDQSDLGVTIKLDDTGLLHLVVQIVTLTGTLTDTTENGVTTVGLGNVVLHHVSSPIFHFVRFGISYNQLLNEHGLTDTGTTEQTNLTTTGVGGEKVDNLDTGDENLSLGGLVDECGRIGVDGSELGGLDGTTLVNGVTSDVDDTAQGGGTDGDGDGGTSVGGKDTTGETLGTLKESQSKLLLLRRGALGGSLHRFGQENDTVARKGVKGRGSLPSMAIVRTTPSPRCCCEFVLAWMRIRVQPIRLRTATSRTSFWPLFVVSMAL
jgi:peptide chain release factor 1